MFGMKVAVDEDVVARLERFALAGHGIWDSEIVVVAADLPMARTALYQFRESLPRQGSEALCGVNGWWDVVSGLEIRPSLSIGIGFLRCQA